MVSPKVPEDKFDLLHLTLNESFSSAGLALGAGQVGVPAALLPASAFVSSSWLTEEAMLEARHHRQLSSNFLFPAAPQLERLFL